MKFIRSTRWLIEHKTTKGFFEECSTKFLVNPKSKRFHFARPQKLRPIHEEVIKFMYVETCFESEDDGKETEKFCLFYLLAYPLSLPLPQPAQ